MVRLKLGFEGSFNSVDYRCGGEEGCSVGPRTETGGSGFKKFLGTMRRKPSGVAEKGWTIVDGILSRCSISGPGCFSPYISNLRLARSGLHDQGDISPQNSGESRYQHDDMSIDRLVHWQLWALVEES